MTFLRVRSTGERVRPGDILTTHGGEQYTFQRVGEPGHTIIVARTGPTHTARARRINGFSNLEWAAT